MCSCGGQDHRDNRCGRAVYRCTKCGAAGCDNHNCGNENFTANGGCKSCGSHGTKERVR